MLEKEVKILIESPTLGELKKLLEKDLKFLGEEKQEDIYFNFIYRNFKVTDEAVRIRKTNGKIEVTYKGPKSNSTIKAREEITVVIENLDNMISLLQRIGFYVVTNIVKTRLNYLDGNFIISLDYVENLGEFIEIEATTRMEDFEIQNYTNNFVRKYNIKGKLTTKSYLELILDKHEKNTSYNSNSY